MNPSSIIPSEAEADRVSSALLVEWEHLQFRAVFQEPPETLPPLPEDTADENVFFYEFLGQDVIQIWEDLRAIVAEHEPLIRKLWKNSSRNQRAHILVSAWGAMPTCHSSDLGEFEKDLYYGQKQNQQRASEIYAFPHINIEDLQSTNPLLLLIDCRSRNHPNRFLSLDWTTGVLGLSLEKAWCPNLDGYKIDVLGREGSYYGKLWKDTQAYYQDNGCYYDVNMATGNIVYLLQLQHRLLEFILRACRIIVSQAATLSEPKQHPKCIEKELYFLGHKKPGQWPTALMESFEKPYSTPRKWDLWEVKNLFMARMKTAEEHVLNLKEDAEYFFSSLKLLHDHDNTFVDSSGACQQPAGDFDSESTWTRSIGKLIEESYVALLFWRMFHSQLERLVTHSEMLDMNPLKTVVIPDNVVEDLWVFQQLLENSIDGVAKVLAETLIPDWIDITKAPEDETVVDWVKSKISNDEASRDKVGGYIQALMVYPARRFMGGERLIHDIERLVLMDKRQRERFTCRTFEIFSELALLQSASQENSLILPFYLIFDQKRSQYQDTIDVRVMDALTDSLKFRDCLKSRTFSLFCSLQVQLKEEYHCQVADPGSFHVRNEKKAVSQVLEHFWESADFFMENELGDSLTDMIFGREDSDKTLSTIEQGSQGDPLSGPAYSFSTKEDAALLIALREEYISGQATVTPIEQCNQDDQISDQVSPIEQCTQEDQISELIGQYKKDDKVSELVISIEQCKLDDEISRIKDPDARFLLEGELFANCPSTVEISTRCGFQGQMDIRVYNVFATLFCGLSHGKDVRLFTWQEFCWAMYAVGFDPMKQYGSLWHFQKGRGKFAQAVQFHEPFDTDIVSFLNARIMGDRLVVEFQWWLNKLPKQERSLE